MTARFAFSLKMHNICIMNEQPLIQAEAIEVSRLLADAGYSQEKTATALGFSQSQVSRLLSGKFKRRTKLFEKICIFAYKLSDSGSNSKGEASRQPELIAALNAVWDGSPAHAKALAVVIRSLGALSVIPQRSVDRGNSHLNDGNRQ